MLGSGGRGESLLKPDQDNAIIFEDGDPGSAADKWFEELGVRFADILDEAGIPLCNGGVMAKNPEWRGSVTTWDERVRDWIGRTSPEDLLNVDIFFDQIAVSGERSLAVELFRQSYDYGHDNVGFAKAMAGKLEGLSNPFGLFGRLKTQDNKIDLKLHGLFPLVTAARTLAIRHNIARHSTADRLGALIERGEGDVALMERLVRDHEFLLSVMLEAQERQVSSGHKPTNLVDVSKLSRNRHDRLKEALSNIQYLPELVKDQLF